MSPYPIGVLASGTGTNFDAIAAAIDDGTLLAEISVVICNRAGARVVDKARARGLSTRLVDHDSYDSREDFDGAIVEVLQAAGVELVVMAGFDRLVTRTLLAAYPQRVINVHPAILPAFKGLDAQRQAADYGVRIAGATVHIVDEDVDHGPIIVQAAVPARPGEDPEALRRRILAQEHRIYPYAISLFAQGRITVKGRRVVIAGEPPLDAADDQALISPAPQRTDR